MTTLINVSAGRFSIDGIQYFKNFTPVVNGDYIRIVNTYDSALELVGATLYSDFIIDTITYGTVALTQAALLPVLFTRETLGGVGAVSWGEIAGDIQNQTDLIELFADPTNIENYYADIAELLSDQGNQTADKLQYVADASGDPNVTSGERWYKFLGTTTANLNDYLLMPITILNAKPKDPWIWNVTEDCYMVKGAGNVDQVTLEDGDIVYEKEVTHLGVQVVLRGWQKNAGSSSVIESYTKIKSYA